MSKDPAILFYTSDFLTGTMFFSMEERGEYITLLCVQHQGGPIPKKDFFSITKPGSKVAGKFSIDEKGFYFNEVLSKVIVKRKEFSDSRRNNRLGKVKKSLTSVKQVNNTSSLSLIHMENENENEIENIIVLLNTETGKNYKSKTLKTKQAISARIKDGYSFNDFETVIKKKVKEWTGTEWEKHLTPDTLFRQANFEKYLNQSGNLIQNKTKAEQQDDYLKDYLNEMNEVNNATKPNRSNESRLDEPNKLIQG